MHDAWRYGGGRLAGWCVLALALFAAGQAGCVRRTLTVNTEPQGAIVWLNGEEVGRSPVTVDFLWYGDYEVVARMSGYQTLQTHHELKAPWYQWAGIDFFTEILYPGHIVDARTAEFALSPEQLPGPEQLLDNAAELRARAMALSSRPAEEAPAEGHEVPAVAPAPEAPDVQPADALDRPTQPANAPASRPSAAPQVESRTPAPPRATTPRTSAPSPRSTSPSPNAPQEMEMLPAPEHPEVEPPADGRPG